jgi:tetrahydromethanopterin S-methyltransferase subunit G
MTDDSLEERLTALETTVAEVREQFDRAMNRDIPLLKGTVRAAINAEIDDIGKLPDAGRTFNRQVRAAEERLDAVERQLAALGDIGTEKTTK